MDSPPLPIPESLDTDSRLCPHCHSTDIRSSRAIYDRAKNYARSSISRVAVTGGAGFYLDGANVRPTPETLMAAKFPPPNKPRFSWWLLLLAVMSVAFLYFCLTEWVGTSAWLALLICLAGVSIDYMVQRYVLQKKMAAYQKKYEAWENTWVCMTCEESFIPRST